MNKANEASATAVHTIVVLTDCASTTKHAAIKNFFDERYARAPLTKVHVYPPKQQTSFDAPIIHDGRERAEKLFRRVAHRRLTALGKQYARLPYNFMVTIQRGFVQENHRWHLWIIAAVETPGNNTYYSFSELVALPELVSNALDTDPMSRYSAMQIEYPGWNRETDSMYETITKTSETARLKTLLQEALAQVQ